MSQLTDKGSLYLNGEWVEANGPFFSTCDSATYKKIWEGKEATDQDVDKAFEAAKDALPSWSSTSFATRVNSVHRFSDLLKKSQSTFAKIISAETGKPLWESYSEVESMISKVAISQMAHEERCKNKEEMQGMHRLLVRHFPHGIVAILAPYNFPGHLSLGHMIPALLAGNTLVLKPSEHTPKVAEELFKIWEKVGLPKGVINLVQGGASTGKAVASHPLLDGLFFTGSYETGLKLATQFAGQFGKILALEMGGNNPLVVGSISDIKAAVYRTIQSAYLTAGQRCTCARRLILIENSHTENFLESLVSCIKKIKVGRYFEDPEPFMGCLINPQAALKVRKKQQERLSQGAHLLCEAKPLPLGDAFLSPGLIDVTPIRDIEDVEIFGPLLQVTRVADFEQALSLANKTIFGLSAGLFSDNPSEWEQFHQRVKAGIINWNMPLTQASSKAPFGGVKSSGNFRPGAFFAADYSSYPIASQEMNHLAVPETLMPGIYL